MKALIAATCCAVLVVSGWSLADRWQAHKAKVAQAEFETWQDNCFDTIDNLIAGKGMNKNVLTNCLWRGGQPMKDELNRRLVAAGREPIE
jgi:hypothetical protein